MKKNKFAKRSLALGLASVWLISFVLISFLPVQDKYLLHTRGRLHPLAHFFALFVLIYLLLCTIRSIRGISILLTAALILACTIEIAQGFMNSTAIEWSDLAIDVCGIFTGAVFVQLWKFTQRGQTVSLKTPPQPAADGRKEKGIE